MQRSDFEDTFDQNTKVWGVYKILSDQQWHCRECEYKDLHITQIAGGSGIQGLQRGSKSRPGIVIESKNDFCWRCGRRTRHDKWNGQYASESQSASMPSSFVKRAIRLFKSRDIIEGTERPANQLTLDHKLPMLRWNDATEVQQTSYKSMTDDDIISHFQLLKKSNGSVSHNLLKSRACEKCYRTGQRGKPFGINFFYSGDKKWAPQEKNEPSGCIGCGWYDFAKWREELNKKLKENS